MNLFGDHIKPIATNSFCYLGIGHNHWKADSSYNNGNSQHKMYVVFGTKSNFVKAIGQCREARITEGRNGMEKCEKRRSAMELNKPASTIKKYRRQSRIRNLG